jgi:hypothetical protein
MAPVSLHDRIEWQENGKSEPCLSSHYSDRWHNVPQLLEHSEGILTHVINRTAIQDLFGCIAGELDVSRQRNVVFRL